MKKFLRRISAILVISMIMNAVCLPACSTDIVISEMENIEYTREEQAILDKIDELSKANVAINQYKHMHNISGDEIIDPMYAKLIDVANDIRDELILMGAKPSNEQLAQFKLEEPISINGNLIDDFALFEEEFGDEFNIWGLSHTVNASYGTFYTYEILIQDISGHSKLSTHIEQSGRDGWDLYAETNPFAEFFVDEVNAVMFERFVKVTQELYGFVEEKLLPVVTFIKTLITAGTSVYEDEPITVGGSNTASHIVYCDLSPTIHFVHVRTSPNEDWDHAFTTNRVAVLETHDWYVVVTQNGSLYALEDRQEVYDNIVCSDNYNYRLTNAIRIYQGDKSWYAENIYEYTVYAIGADDEIEAFSVEVACPEDAIDLERYI